MARFLPIEKKRVEAVESPFWISFADLMTAMVMLFLVVMSISMVAISSKTLIEKKIRESEIQEVMEEIEKQAAGRQMEIVVDRNTQTIEFGPKAQFAFDSYLLSQEAREALRAFVPLLLESQNTDKGKRWLKRIHIEGYTDPQGTYLYNVNLSLKRAEAVVCALFAAEMPPERVRQLQKLLIIDGASITGIKADPQESRRVEIRLEFRTLGEMVEDAPAPQVELGRCVINIGEEKGGDAKVKGAPSRR